jgi:hypothetical protein
MKRILCWHFFLSALCCTFLAVSFFAGGGIASAASRSFSIPAQANVPADQFVNVYRDLSCQDGDVKLNNTGFVCFALKNSTPPSEGYAYINVYDVYLIETGNYNLSFSWTDCHGFTHNSVKPPHTNLATNSGGFGGCNYMQDVWYIDLLN